MSPLPREMADRWQSRPEPGPGQAQLYWHILMKDQPEVLALAALAQQRLASFPGLHFTPPQCLHSTVLRVGLKDDIAAASIGEMIEQARQRLRAVRPVGVSLGLVLYHPEAIALGVRHDGHREMGYPAGAFRSSYGSLSGFTDGVEHRVQGLQHRRPAGRPDHRRARTRPA